MNSGDLIYKALQPIAEKDMPKLLSEEVCVFCIPPEQKILIETNNYFVSLDTSPLIEGHVLIHTKRHINCAGEAKDTVEELIMVKDYIGSILKDIYGQVSFYEHGRAGSCGVVLNNQNCEHFHLHALPLSIDISDLINEKFEGVNFGDYKLIVDLYEKYPHYLFFENCNQTKYIYPVSDALENHYLRTVIANLIYHPERANYKNYSHSKLELINNFISKLNKYARFKK